VGVIAKHLLHKSSNDLRNEGFMCGILHDIGRLIYVKLDPAKFAAFHGGGEVATDLEAETKFFGIDHQKLGEMLARKWNFPESIALVIARHHDPPVSDKYGILVSAINIADMLCHSLSIGDSGNYFVAEFSAPAWKLLEIEMPELENIMRRALSEIDKSNDMINEIH
jgi:putative nucleotidyltransferase with HDIG domain